MNNKFSSLTAVVSVALSFLLMLVVLSVHEAYASSCFTDTGGYWAENFICWMKTTGLSSGYSDGTFRPNNAITRAEVAALLYKEASGDTYVNMGPNAWQVNGGSPGYPYVNYYTNEAVLRSTTTGLNVYQVSLPVITSLHNQQMTAKGAKLCYNAHPTAGGSIVYVAVTIEDATGAQVAIADDGTTRTDATCRAYYFSTPFVLTGTDSMAVDVTTSLAATIDYVEIYGTTAIQGFTPTAGVLAPSLGSSGPIPSALP